jgi:hypothetical protein
MALSHKRVSYRTIAWRYSYKHVLAFTAQGSVPVIRHKQRGIADSRFVSKTSSLTNMPFSDAILQLN